MQNKNIQIKWATHMLSKEVIEKLEGIDGEKFDVNEIIELFLNDLSDLIQRPRSWEAAAIRNYLDGHGIYMEEK